MRHLIYLSVVLVLIGCTQQKSMKPKYSSVSDPQNICYEVADRLAAQLHMKNIRKARLIKVAFVDIDNVNQVSSTGRAYSEFIATRLCQLGYEVVELKMREDSIQIIPQKGELILSYDQLALAKEHDASAAIIGYYKTKAIGGYRRDAALFVRIVNINNNAILAADDYSTWR